MVQLLPTPQIVMKKTDGTNFANEVTTIVYQHFSTINKNIPKTGMELTGTELTDFVLGTPGDANGVHLHLELRSSTHVHNPLLYFNNDDTKNRINGDANFKLECFYQQYDQNDNPLIPWTDAITQPNIPINYYDTHKNTYIIPIPTEKNWELNDVYSENYNGTDKLSGCPKTN